MLRQIGVDFNAPQRMERPTMLDMAAKRGNLDMTLMLIHYGAIETETTLSYAIKSQNRAVIDLFLNGGKADGLSFGSDLTTPYAEAIRMRDETLMQTLEQMGSWSNIEDHYRYVAALDAAMEVRNIHILRRLLKIPNIQLHREALANALSTAVGANDEEVAIMLIHAGAGPRKDIHSPQPLHKALENRNTQLVRDILNFEATDPVDDDRSLVLAAKWGNISIIEDLLISGCRINPEFVREETPLIVGIRKQDWQLIRFLLNAGSDVNAIYHGHVENEFRTALSAAAEIQDIDMVKYLLSVGADPGDSDALLNSCSKGIDVLSLLLEAFLKSYPNGKRGYFDDAVADAVQKSNISILKNLRPVMALQFPGYSQHVSELIGTRLIANNEVSLRAVQMLLDSGANPDVVVWSENESERMTVLSAAIEAKNVQMVRLFLDNGAKVDFPAMRGIKFTPIQKAAQTGCYEIVLELINRGADVDAPAADAGGGTAIQLAAIGGFLGIAELLLKKGAKINRAPSILHGRTALEGAAEWGRLDMVQFLLQSGAEIDGRGRKSFLNAMKLAEENGHFAVLGLLQSYLS